MPILKHAKKKLKQDKRRTAENKKFKVTFKKLVKKAKEDRTPESVSKAFSSVDKAAKKNVLPKNRAARIKSALTKSVAAPAKVAVASVKAKTKKAKMIAKKKTVARKATPKRK